MSRPEKNPDLERLHLLAEELRELNPRPEKISKKGARAYAAIVKAARAILIKEGYAGISFGKLAEATNYGKGNIAYYFPTKSEILEAIIFEEIAGSFDFLIERLKACADPTEKLKVYIESFITRNLLQNRFSAQLWCVMLNDEAAGKFIRRDHSLFITLFAGLIQMARPQLSRKQAHLQAATAASFTAGVILYSAIGFIDVKDIESVSRMAAQHLERQIRQA